MTTVDVTRLVTGGVDHPPRRERCGGTRSARRAVRSSRVPDDACGPPFPREFLASFGTLTRVGVEGTGSYGAGLSRYLRGSAVEVVEVEHRSGMSAEMLAEVKHSWCRPSDNAIHQDFYWQPQRDSNPCLHLERVDARRR